MDQNRQNQRKDQKIEPRGSDKSKGSFNRYRYGQDEKDELRLWNPKKTGEA